MRMAADAMRLRAFFSMIAPDSQGVKACGVLHLGLKATAADTATAPIKVSSTTTVPCGSCIQSIDPLA